MTLTTNPELELAFDYVQHTNKNIFLTGKAGTGKTTFLHRIRAESLKRTVVVAPTGVAAINAKGMTIHSFFQLPFGPYVPGSKPDPSRQRNFTRKKINLIKSVDLLIIDEISMVRADMLDAIDEVLRKYKNRRMPFGGAQLLMIGDLHQLPPVVKEEEWRLLNEHYQTPYFFGSQALQMTNPITVQLKHIYRQSDDTFIHLLNKVRDNQMDAEILETLNGRFREDFQPKEEEGYITLTSHNAAAYKINQTKLDDLATPLHQFTAKIEGNFPNQSYPTEETLSFKEGAQVLFIKNDTSMDKLYYNGKIGQITRIDEGVIYVKCPGDPSEIGVGMVSWTNVKYDLDEKTKEVTEEEIGKFTQYPLKLAWAITIHKSQGLTFERAIIDAAAAFAHGQVYVALSRCKSFEGVVLHSRIDYSSVKTDTVVKNYSEKAELNAPNESDLEDSKREFQESLLIELFDFQQIKYGISDLSRLFLAHENVMTTAAVIQVNEWGAKVDAELILVSRKFLPQLKGYFRQEDLPENNMLLQDRLKKASAYFAEKIGEVILPELKKIPVLADSQDVKKRATEQLKKLELLLFIKIKCFEDVQKAFSTQNYLKTRVNAEVDFEKSAHAKSAVLSFAGIPKNVVHPKLYAQIMAWRQEEAQDRNINPYEILPTRSIVEITELLPMNSTDLLKVKGIGKAKVQQFGRILIDLIENYCTANNVKKGSLFDEKNPKKAKPSPTQKMTFDLFKVGRTVQEIASARGLVASIVEGHLLYFVKNGQLDIFRLMTKESVAEILDFFKKNPDVSSAATKTYFGEKYSYSNLRMVRAYRDLIAEKEENKTEI